MDRTKIKVVKKAEVKPLVKKKKRVSETRTAAREMVSTVSEWVSELKQRKTEETRAAIDLLLSTNRQPNES